MLGRERVEIGACCGTRLIGAIRAVTGIVVDLRRLEADGGVADACEGGLVRVEFDNYAAVAVSVMHIKKAKDPEKQEHGCTLFVFVPPIGWGCSCRKIPGVHKTRL